MLDSHQRLLKMGYHKKGICARDKMMMRTIYKGWLARIGKGQCLLKPAVPVWLLKPAVLLLDGVTGKEDGGLGVINRGLGLEDNHWMNKTVTKQFPQLITHYYSSTLFAQPLTFPGPLFIAPPGWERADVEWFGSCILLPAVTTCTQAAVVR